MANAPALADFSHLFNSRDVIASTGSLPALYQQCAQAFARTPLADPHGFDEFNELVSDQLFDDLTNTPSADLIILVDKIIEQFMSFEPMMFKPPNDLATQDLSSLGAQTQVRRDLVHQLSHLADFEQRFFIWSGTLVNLVAPLLKRHTSVSSASLGLHFTTPLFALHPQGNLLIERMMAILSDHHLFDLRFFRLIHLRIRENLFQHYGFQLSDIDHDASLRSLTHKKLLADMEPLEAAKILFARTPLLDLLMAPQPLSVPQEKRFEHTHIVAAPGHGKTQFLQQMILGDLSADPDNIPGMVIIDSHGDMINKIKRLDVFNPAKRSPANKTLADRLLIIDPSDVEFTPELNLFSNPYLRSKSLSARQKEELMNGTIESFDFIFSALMGAELSPQQSVSFRHLAELMLTIPDANIATFSDVLENPQNYLVAINALDPHVRDFLTKRFMSKRYDVTRIAIQSRLDMLLQNRAFARMFGAAQNRLDLFAALNEGKIILVDTNKAFLKEKVSSLFGRYMIAQVFMAMLTRANIAPDKRRPCFLYIDEAAEYMDESFSKLLTQVRKYKLGLVLAHQHMSQIPRDLANDILSSTAIKFTAGLSVSDAKILAPEMKTTPDFLRSFTKTSTGTKFAAYARDITPTAFSHEVKFGTLEDQPKMNDKDFLDLLASSRFQLTGRTGKSPSPSSTKPSTAPPSPAPSTSPSGTAGQSIPRAVDDEMWERINKGHWNP